MNIEDLIFDVKMMVSGKSDNEVLYALRRSYAKFMNTGKFSRIDISITLDPSVLEYYIDTPGDTYIQEILEPSKSGFVFNGTNKITFEVANFELGDILTFKAILGYNKNATSFLDMVYLNRYHEGIVNGAAAYLSPEESKYFYRNFHNALSEAMSDTGTFSGLKG